MSGPPSVPRLRVSSSHGRRKHAEADSRQLDLTDDVDDAEQHEELNIRVRDHGDTEPPPIARKNRIGGLLKDAPTSGLKNLSESVGGAVKRPLSGIFRRPGSRGGGRQKEESSTTSESALKVSGTTEVRSMSPAPRFPANEDASRRSTARDDYDQNAAAAPHITPSQLHGLLQVDALAAKYPHMVKLDDIDISLLSRYLASEEEVADEPIAWTWDTIFTSTSSEMRQEWVQDDDSGDEDPTGRGAISLPYF
ncbi:ift-43 [Pristionchus pacificus]|uniref:Intraflagellar transport protein 43 homolog n=1 Tax=Pristionchus pacificus TaxID=54126 RepID=A0A8R1V4H9_PRIPA|nr:ift-43 [Pristionchus pacificus]